MANFPPLTGAPFASKAPFSHNAANEVSERLVKCINATDGSAHAPTADIELSGVNGGGFSFDTTDPAPFKGKLDVTSGLTCTAPSAGTWTFDNKVNVTIAKTLILTGNMTVGGSSVVAWGGGSSVTGAIDWQAVLSASGDTDAEFVFSTSNPVPFHGELDVTSGLAFSRTSGTAYMTVKTGITWTYNSGSALVLNGNVTVGTGVTWTSGGFTITGSLVTVEADLDVSGDLSLTGNTTFASSTKPLLSPARAWTRRASRVAASTYSGANVSAFPWFAPTYVNTPTMYLGASISSTTEQAVFEFDPPPDGALAVTLTVKSKGQSSVVVPTLPTYELIRWQEGLSADYESMTSVLGDSHTGDATDWLTVHTMTISAANHTTIDVSYRYGVRVTFPRDGSDVTVGCFVDMKLTGTVAVITGQ